MRSVLSQVILSLALLVPPIVQAAAVDTQHQLSIAKNVIPEPQASAKAAIPVEDGPRAGATNSEAVSSNSTTFNGMDVPPMKELDGDMEKDIKGGYWFIKHYSPYCEHCKAIAPTWQTLYEYYYTTKPVPASKSTRSDADSMNSFSRYYNFHFASLDCIAFGDACGKHDINFFPTFSIYKDGALVKKFDDGHKTMESLSKFLEEFLESVRPGSRPKDGVKLPQPGATSVDTDAPPEQPAKKDKDPEAGKAAASKQMEESSAEPTSTPAVPAKTKPGSKKPAAPANPVGTSVALSQETFQKLVTNTQDPWFVKFYAPWCHHCQALAPSWLQMAKELQGKLNLGEVNCDVEVRLCKDIRVKAYPTIHFFRGGERVEYDGLRGLGDLVSFAKKALDVGGGVQSVDAKAFKDMEETEEVIFVYFYDHATTSEDFEALERLMLSLIGHAKLVKTDNKELVEQFKISTWPRLLISRDGRPKYYDVLAPNAMRDFRQVLNWMQSVWLPIVPELTASNSREIMRNKYVVLGILSRNRADEFVLDKREIKNAALDWMEKQTHAFGLERQEMRDAKQLLLEEAEDRNDDRAKRAAKSIQIDIKETDKKQVGFAWVDGVFWERWIKTTYGIRVNDGERVVIVDVDNRRYWDTTISGAPIVPSRTSILETIPKVIAFPPEITSKSSTSLLQRVFFGFRGTSSKHPWVSLGLLIGILLGASIWGRGRIRRGKGSGSGGVGAGGGGGGGGGFFQLDGKEGLLNGVGYGKAD